MGKRIRLPEQGKPLFDAQSSSMGRCTIVVQIVTAGRRVQPIDATTRDLLGRGALAGGRKRTVRADGWEPILKILPAGIGRQPPGGNTKRSRDIVRRGAATAAPRRRLEMLYAALNVPRRARRRWDPDRTPMAARRDRSFRRRSSRTEPAPRGGPFLARHPPRTRRNESGRGRR